MKKWKKMKASKVFPDFKPVRNPKWLWDKYGMFYDPLIWVQVDR